MQGDLEMHIVHTKKRKNAGRGAYRHPRDNQRKRVVDGAINAVPPGGTLGYRHCVHPKNVSFLQLLCTTPLNLK